MSKPIINYDCGCCVSTEFNRHDWKPFYTYFGKETIEYVTTCPKLNPEHIFKVHMKEIKFFGMVIGYLRWKEGHFSRYIIILSRKFIKYFPYKDVFIEETQEWNFV